MSDNKSFPEINGLFSGLRTFDTPVRQTPAPVSVAEAESEANNIISESPPVIGPSEQNTLWEEFMHNLRECPARCRKPDRLSYFIDKDIADSISECNIEKRSNSDIINAILRTFLSLNIEQFNMYRQESRTLFNTKNTEMSKLNWTDEMIALLKELYPNETIEKVASLLGVGKTSVKNKAIELGLEKGIKREWLEKVEKVRKLNSTHSIAEIADKVGVSERTVSRIKAYLSLSKNKEEDKAMRSRIRNEIIQRERRRMIFGLDPITKIKIVTNKKRLN